MLQQSGLAPEFKLVGDDGHTYSLSGYKGSWLVVYFYPKDDTPGCTTEACVIRDMYSEFTEMGVTVFGISTDSVESHVSFKAKYGLPFILLSDPDADAIVDYDAQNALGGTKRMTYIVNPEGRIAKMYARVDPATHAGLLLADLAIIMS